MTTDYTELRRLAGEATPGPWAVQDGFPLYIVPADQVHLARGGASDPDKDRQRYAQYIATSHYDDTPGEWRAKFPHRRLNRTVALADAAFIAAAHPSVILALLDELEASRRVVEAVRTALPVISDMTRVVRMKTGVLDGEAAVVLALRESLAGLRAVRETEG